ncbi:hypothetical protein ACWGJ2_01885 [Streptomyces sp. NPDC054796]
MRKGKMRNLRMSLAAGGAVALLVFTPTAAVADVTTIAWDPAGFARFNGYGEHLYACDLLPEGAEVWAQAKWDNEIKGWAIDTDGYAGDCGHENLSIPEGQDVNIRVCVGGYCNAWKDSEA